MNIEIFKETSDNFYPNYTVTCMEIPTEPKFVKVILSSISDGNFRVGVWGANDFGMIRDHSNIDAARNTFNKIIHLENPITIIKLKIMKFNRF